MFADSSAQLFATAWMSKRVELLEVIDARISSVGAICRCDLCSDSQSNSHMTLMAIAKLPNSVLNVITCRHVPIFYHIHFQVFTRFPVSIHPKSQWGLWPSLHTAWNSSQKFCPVSIWLTVNSINILSEILSGFFILAKHYEWILSPCSEHDSEILSG